VIQHTYCFVTSIKFNFVHRTSILSSYSGPQQSIKWILPFSECLTPFKYEKYTVFVTFTVQYKKRCVTRIIEKISVFFFLVCVLSSRALIPYCLFHSSNSFMRYCCHFLLNPFVAFTKDWLYFFIRLSYIAHCGIFDLQSLCEHRKSYTYRVAYKFPLPCVSHHYIILTSSTEDPFPLQSIARQLLSACLILWPTLPRFTIPQLTWRTLVSSYHPIFFLFISVKAIGGRPKPELCFVPGRMRWTLLPKERYGKYLFISIQYIQYLWYVVQLQVYLVENLTQFFWLVKFTCIVFC